MNSVYNVSVSNMQVTEPTQQQGIISLFVKEGEKLVKLF
jgi:hypothetical protein